MKTKTTKPIPEVFEYRDGILHADGIGLTAIARDFGTPGYVYARRRMVETYRAYDAAFGPRPHLVCYAVKANPANAILASLAAAGAGFDIVSGGELARVLQAGGKPDRIVFSGVGKLDEEIGAALEAGIRCFNVESPSELRRIDEIARRKRCVAPVALRVNPDITADTHPHIATGGGTHKFGIPQEQVGGVAAEAGTLPGVSLHGLAMHIGSQIEDLSPLVSAAECLKKIAAGLQSAGFSLRHIDLGGGLGIGDAAPPVSAYVAALLSVFDDDEHELVIEPGRSIAGPAGVLLTRVICIKHTGVKSFAIVDAGMNDLLRPALYGASHEIRVVDKARGAATGTYDVVGPVCETADTLGSRRRLAIREGSLLAVMDTGAYGATMSSHYNSRPRCVEVTVADGAARLTRKRETIEDLGRSEMAMNASLPG